MQIVNVHFAQPDTILLPLKEQNRLSKTNMSRSLEFIPRFALLSLVFCVLALVGCSQSVPEPIAETPASARPPLKIWIVDAPELEKEISVRWQAASDQALRIEVFAMDGFAAREPFTADVVIYPALMLGDLVQKQVIGRLPPQVTANRGLDNAEPAPTDGGVSLWPVRWRNSATFGSQLFAVPLGATNLGIAMVGTEGTLSLQNHSSGKDANSKSMEEWTQFLDRNEAARQESRVDRETLLEKGLLKLSPLEKSFLVDRFLFIASTTDARNRGLFELVKMESRLNMPEFINSATILSRLSRLFPESILSEPTRAWEMTVAKSDASSGFAIGWPNVSLSNSSDLTAKVTVAPLAWNPSRGLLASIGKKTRQTAVSRQFLAWLSEPDQREALRSVCSRIELVAGQNDRNGIRDDYRAFQAANSHELPSEPMGLSLRMANADQYRAILADSLVEALRSPDKIESILAGCSTKWNQLTTTLGIETQRISEEQSLGYRK
jgi:hypothetical protein